MHLSSLSLHHFRNYAKKTFAFKNGFTVVTGENARGKTNILEAISLLANGESFRARRIEEMVQWEHEVGRAEGVVDDAQNNHNTLEVVVTTGLVQGERVQKRKFLVDGVSKRRKDFIGNLFAVTFRPEDLDLMTDGPSLRRAFLNTVLSQASWEYRHALELYEKALRRRNALLDVLRDGQTTRASFPFWDQLLIEHGSVLTNMRRSFVETINSTSDFPLQFTVLYDSSVISEKRLHQYAIEEVSAGHTLVGPHKDDFTVTLMERNIHSKTKDNHAKDIGIFGSRGEQRMAVLWLKIQEMEYLEKKKGVRPILLLDDILSELDEKHQHIALDLAEKQQTILTTADLDRRWKKNVEVMKL